MLDHDDHHRRRVCAGLLYGVAAYAWWGFVMPTYFKTLQGVNPFELLAHRVLWGLPFIAVLLTARGLWGEFRHAITTWSSLGVLLITSALICVNWFSFLYAIVSDRLIESSLGYYINPLVSVALGMFFLGERVRPLQIVAFGIAALAVAYRTWTAFQGGYPYVPWIPPAVALSFGFYGLLRKRAHAGPTVGLAVEMAVLFVPMAALLAVLGLQDRLTIFTGVVAGAGDAEGAWTPLAKLGVEASPGRWGGWWMSGMLALAGGMTVVPLIWFANAARRLRLVTIGLLQYIAPTGQFIMSLLFENKFDREWLYTFAAIWLALGLYTFDSWRGRKRRPELTPPE